MVKVWRVLLALNTEAVREHEPDNSFGEIGTSHGVTCNMYVTH